MYSSRFGNNVSPIGVKAKKAASKAAKSTASGITNDSFLPCNFQPRGPNVRGCKRAEGKQTTGQEG